MTITFDKLISVTATQDAGNYIAKISIMEDGVKSEVNYGVNPTDKYGIAPQVRMAVTNWVIGGKPVTPFVPDTVEQVRENLPPITGRQLRLVLLQMDIADFVVENALQNSPGYLIEWKYATSFKRLHPAIAALATLLGLTDPQVDDLWTYAGTL